MRARQGWTLLELLIVIAIIALLAAIIYAVAIYAIDQSRQARCISNLRQIGMALKLYIEDYKQADWETEIRSYHGVRNERERHQLVSRWGFPHDPFWLFQAGYISDEDIFKCSNAPQRLRELTRVHYAYHSPDVLLLPPFGQGVNTWDDFLWVLKQQEWDYPIMYDCNHDSRDTFLDLCILLRLDGRVDKKRCDLRNGVIRY
ncbi:hypothetical protein HRbin15_00656 [bacterium HR15]|nr:hypothetical protein HRbin15_00656 [bacterium HR15]